MTPTILVFDSGLGGLTVHRELTKARPDARYIYAADDAFFPYGKQREAELVERVLTVMGELIAAHRPDLVVVACNTASTLVLPQLRAKFQVPFVGTVPAIKPACAASKTRLVSVLGTEATVQREYTRALIRDFADGCAIHLVGSPRLAELAEAELHGQTLADADIAAEIAPCFIERNGARTDTIVLACTHYPLLLDRLRPPGALAGGIYRPGTRDRAADGRSAGPAGRRPRGDHPLHLHLGPRAFPLSKGRFGGLWHCRNRPCRRLTCPHFPPKYPPSRGPFGPRGVSRSVVWAGASAQACRFRQCPEQRRTRSSNLTQT